MKPSSVIKFRVGCTCVREPLSTTRAFISKQLSLSLSLSVQCYDRTHGGSGNTHEQLLYDIAAVYQTYNIITWTR